MEPAAKQDEAITMMKQEISRIVMGNNSMKNISS